MKKSSLQWQDRKSASTPIDTEKPLLEDPDGEDVDVHTYRSMIGSLMYLTSSRPDIMFAVRAYSDYAGASLDKKSTTRGCQFLGYRLISWQYKKQTVIATSSIKAEYVATASCCAQVLWIQNLLLDHGVQVSDLSSHSTKYSSLALKQKVFANMRRVGKGFYGAYTPLFEGMLVAHKVGEGATRVNVKDVPAAGVAVEGAAEGATSVADDDINAADDEPSIPSPTPPTQSPPPSQDIPPTSQVQLTPPQSPQVQPPSPQQQPQPS
nr:uncharacterized mitochondrial protein AtMg00810-like [Tanacetum cinerariifolium]